MTCSLVHFGQGAAGFSPGKLPGLALWLISSKGVTLSGSSVTHWADQSGSGDAARTFASVGTPPTFTASDAAFNGAPSINFDRASSEVLLSGTWSSPLVQPVSIFAVGLDSGAASNQTYFAGDSFGLLGDTNDGYTGFGIYSGGSVGGTEALSSAPRIVGGVFNGASSKVYTNAKTPVGSGNAGAAGATLLSVGAEPTRSAALAGSIVEVVVCEGVLSDANIGKLFDSWSAAYGIAIGP